MTWPSPGREPAPDIVTAPAGRGPLGPVLPFDAAVEADVVAAAVLTVPGVAALHGGAFGEIATYLPGRKVTGVRIDPVDTRGAGGPPRIEVHVVARYPVRIAVVADGIRSALAGVIGDRIVDVVVEDYAAPGDTPTETDPGPPGT